MAATPKFKVYSSAGEYVGCAKYAEDAAAFAGLHGAGSTVRAGHRTILWTVGAALDSFDDAADAIYSAFDDLHVIKGKARR